MPSAPTLDGTGTNANTAGGASSATVTLTTSLTNDIIVVCSSVENNTSSAPNVSSITATGLTFYFRSGGTYGGSVANRIEIWWAYSSAILTSKTITVNYSTVIDDFAIIAFGVNGCNTANPWDTNTTLPLYKIPVSNAGNNVSISTNYANDFLFAFGGSAGTQPFTQIVTAWTTLASVATGAGTNYNRAAASYTTVNSVQTNLNVSLFLNGNSSNAVVVDALTANGSSLNVIPTKPPILNFLQRKQITPIFNKLFNKKSASTLGANPPNANISDNATTTDSLVTIDYINTTLVDVINSSDFLFLPQIADTSVSTDAFISTSIVSETISDTGLNSSDTLSEITNVNVNLIDETRSSDQFQFPEIVVSALYKETLTSGGSKVTLAFSGLRKQLLVAGASLGNNILAFSGLRKTSLVMIVPGAGPIPIFPSLPQDFPIKLSPVLDTTIGTTKSLREMRVAQQTYPLWDIEISFEELVDQTQNQTPYAPFAGYEQFQQLVQLWLSMYGQTQVFAFSCPWDNSRANQLIGTGDGKTYVFTIVRTWGLGNQATTDPVGMVNAITSVQVGGITVPSTKYFVARDKLYFIDAKGFIYPPAANEAITMTFSYYYLCRFVEDEQDFEEFAKNRWNVSSLKFRAVIWI